MEIRKKVYFFLGKFPIFSWDFFYILYVLVDRFLRKKSFFLYGFFYSYTAKNRIISTFFIFLIRKNVYRKSTILRGQKLSAIFLKTWLKKFTLFNIFKNFGYRREILSQKIFFCISSKQKFLYWFNFLPIVIRWIIIWWLVCWPLTKLAYTI